jgi:hypothetical protein
MPKPKPKAHDLTTEQAVKHLFPKEAREALVLEAKKSRKPEPKASTDGKSS